MYYTSKHRVIITAVLLSAAIAVPLYLFSADVGNTLEESWVPNDTRKQYKNLAEERFSLECDYLGIDGGRRGTAQELFDTLLARKSKLDAERSEGKISRVSAIYRKNRIELKYYLKLKELVTGDRNLARLSRMINKVRARNNSGGKLSAQAD